MNEPKDSETNGTALGEPSVCGHSCGAPPVLCTLTAEVKELHTCLQTQCPDRGSA